MKKSLKIAAVVFSCLFAISAVNFALSFAEYAKSEEEYDDILERNVVEAPQDIEDETAEEEIPQDIDTEETAEEEEIPQVIEEPADEEGIPQEIVEEEPAEEEVVVVEVPEKNYDYDGFKEENADFIGVLYIPALDLEYPVVQGTDNEHYLEYSFSGEKSSSASIMLDADADSSMTDDNTFVFGHNMKNLSMFGSLKRFLNETGLCERNPYIYLYTEKGTYKYEIFAYRTVSVSDEMYDMFLGDCTDEEYWQYLGEILDNNCYSGTVSEGLDLSERQTILTLSTCYQTAHTHNFTVNAALVGVAEG